MDKKVCFQTRIDRLTKNGKDFIVVTGKSGSGPNCNVGKRYVSTRNRAKYVIKTFEDDGFFIVWDYERHKEMKNVGASLTSCLLGTSLDLIDFSFENFIDVYKQLGYRGPEQPFEKVLIVKESFFEKFFLECDRYMAFNEDDISFPTTNSDAVNKAKSWANPLLRKRYSTSQAKRDATFRNEVLTRYHHRCAICGCDVLTMLQAAHEHGHTVAETSYDDPEHGICLCANHHLLYDKEELEIDLAKGIFIANNQISKLKWFPEYRFCESGNLNKPLK